MTLPAYIVTSSSPVSDVADTEGDNTFTGSNTFQEVTTFQALSATAGAYFGGASDRISISSAGNISLEGNATQYDDLVFEMTPSRRNPAVTVPDWDNTRIGFLFPQNDPTEIINIAVQMPHSWKQGSDIYPHVHVQQEADQQAVFKLDYDWVNIGASITGTAWTTYSMTTYVQTYAAGATHNIIYNPTPISGSGKTMSSLFKCKLYRDDNVYTGDMLASQFDIHIEKDSFGSNTEYTK